MLFVDAISSFAGKEFENLEDKWWGSISGTGGFIYGVPFRARRVVKFNPIDQSRIFIGPDLGDNAWWKWRGGVQAGNKCIYCAPFNADRILKIDTRNGSVTEIDVIHPEQGVGKWASGALGLDGNIYFMPYEAHHILKFNPENETMCSVGYDVGSGCKYSGTVVDNNGYVYGIPSWSNRIIKFDPVRAVTITIFLDDEAETDFECDGNGILGRDGSIYAAKRNGRVLKIDTVNNSSTIVGDVVKSNHRGYGWTDGVLGIDGCIYWPPHNASRILRYDPLTDYTALVGRNFGDRTFKWTGGALAPNGIIYCVPCNATHILMIDPFKDFTLALQRDMKQFPEMLGLFFQRNSDGVTACDRAISKYGKYKVLQAVEGTLPHSNELLTGKMIYPFMAAAASPDDAPLSVIYNLFRQNPSFVQNRSPEENKRH